MPIGNIGRYTDATRHYVRLNDGNVVTRATAENMYAQSQGYGTNYERKKAYANPKFRAVKNSPRHVRNARSAEARGMSKQEFDALTARMMQDPANKAPDGPLADWLVATGRRSANETYPVGDSIYI